MKANKYFIYTGNAYPHKNLQRLIEAIVLLNKNSNQLIKLKIVSSRNIFTQRLEKYINYSKASKYVDLLGYVEDKKLDLMYRESVAFVFPSLSEGFGLPGIEAIRSGTLLLASQIPVFNEIYEDNAIYFNPLDFTSIAKSMEAVLEIKSEERKNRIKKAQEFVKKYSWSKMAEETLNIYEELSK